MEVVKMRDPMDGAKIYIQSQDFLPSFAQSRNLHAERHSHQYCLGHDGVSPQNGPISQSEYRARFLSYMRSRVKFFGILRWLSDITTR
jgi:hypothetical protein